LNLYSGIGGNRRLWEGVDVTAVEMNPKIAAIYQDFFPNDKVVVGDAHQYLLEHHHGYDLVWSSRPCQSHSRCNNFLHAQGVIRYPDLALYEEVIFLKHYCDGKWIAENVMPYYKPLINPTAIIDRHYFWANFNISPFHSKRNFNAVNAGGNRLSSHKKEMERLMEFLDIKFNKSILGIRESVFALRNCVEPELGLHILNESKRDVQPELFR